MTPRLKVFQAHIGFFDTVVSARSKKAALEAWGSRQDLFQEGLASATTDPDAVKAATAKPGIVLKRSPGSHGSYCETPALPQVTPKKGTAKKSAARPAVTKHAAKKPAAKKPVPPQPAPDYSAIDHAEQALAALKSERAHIKAEYEKRRAALHAQHERDDREIAERIRKLERNLAEAMRAYHHAMRLTRQHGP